MLNHFSNELIGAILHTILGLILGIIIYFSKKVILWFKSRKVRKFWRPFLGKSLTLIITEYPVSGNDHTSKIAIRASSGWLISKGMAMSLARMLEFCQNKVTSIANITISGAKTGKVQTSNIIILGSPINNPYSKLMYDKVNSMYNIPFKIEENKDYTKIEITTNSGLKFSPELDNGVGEDFALVIKCTLQEIPLKTVLLVAGCYMWGTESATEAVTHTGILNEVARHTNNSNNVAFLIKTRIVNENGLGPEIEIENQKYLSELIKRK